jgi:hypothetical protein
MRGHVVAKTARCAEDGPSPSLAQRATFSDGFYIIILCNLDDMIV